MVKVQLIQDDVLEGLKDMADESVHCVVTSPPYWGLRDYGTAQWEGGDEGCEHKVRKHKRLSADMPKSSSHADVFRNSSGYCDSTEHYQHLCPKCGARRIDAQLGLEKTPDCLGWATGEPCWECYICNMVAVFREVRRVLRKDGTLWLNMGDSYASSGGDHSGRPDNQRGVGAKKTHDEGSGDHGHRSAPPGLKPKDLCGIPWRLALALQADGWWLRSDIIWVKGNPMPQSVTDRPSTSHEYIFLLTKSARYFWDAEAVKEAVSGTANLRGKKNGAAPSMAFKMQEPGQGNRNNSSFQSYMKDLPAEAGRNCRSVWHINSAPFPSAHFATFPPAIPERCIKAGTSERGCCPSCGAPWRRVVTKSKAVARPDNPNPVTPYGAESGHNNGTGVTTLHKMRESITTGWTPTCKCVNPNWQVEDPQSIMAGLEPVPCTVLDCFGGAMTTALVAAKLGRDSVSIELNPTYVEMGKKRITSALGMLAEVSVKES